MAELSRWDPFRDMIDMRRAMDRMMENSYFAPEGYQQSYNWNLPLDVSENQDAYIVKASIPGIDPNDLDITVQNDTLTIRGEIKDENQDEKSTYHMRERRTGSFMRSITLPTMIDTNRIEAKCDQGVLTLTLPKAEESKPKRIQIQGSSNPSLQSGKSGQNQAQKK